MEIDMEEEEETVILVSQEGKSFTMTMKEAKMSSTIVDLQKEVSDSNEPIVLSDINNVILGKIIEFCRHHKNDKPPPPLTEEQEMLRDFPDPLLVLREPFELTDWDKNFVSDMDLHTCLELIHYAYYMCIDDLRKVAVKAASDFFVGKKHSDILAAFDMDPVTAEEEAEIIRECPWLADRE